MKSTDLIDNDSLRSDVPDFQAGDELKVHVRVVEGGKERIQVFQGDVIGRQGGGLQETYTVRKLSYGVGVERTFPLHSPKIEKIEVMQIGDVNRAKLYYLRDKVGKKARVRAVRRTDKLVSADGEEPDEDELDEPTAETEPESVEPADEAAEAEAAPEAEAAEQKQQEAGEKAS